MEGKIKRVIPFALALALGISILWGVEQQRKREEYRNQLQSMYELSFYELVDGVGNMEIQLSKLLVTDAPESTLNLLNEISHRADSAQAAFAVLPVSGADLSTKFINQIGDLCHSLSQRVMQGQPITQTQRDQLIGLRGQLTTLGNEMRTLQASASEGTVALWSGSLDASIASDVENLAEDPLSKIGNTGLEYPSLVYDGPFSDARDELKKGLDGAWIAYEQAEQIARRFVGEQRVEWALPTEDIAGDMPAFGVELMLSRDGVVTVQVTKQGGHILWMVPEHMPEYGEYDLNECYDAALAFMQRNGYPEMTLSYYQAYNQTAVFNLVPLQEGVLLYPDLIKVQVSMSTGQIIGIEAANYLQNHRERELAPIVEPLEDALLLANRLNVEKTQLALIPKLDKELLCHEITGTFMEEPYILYVDVTTGREVDLLKIIDAEGGKLSM